MGFVGTLPLFVAAGGIMFPTVIGGSLARYRTDWSRWLRVLLVAVALVPIGLVSSGLVDDWGWSWRTLAGVAGLLAIYGMVVAEERATLSPQLDGWRMPRAARDHHCGAVDARIPRTDRRCRLHIADAPR